MNIGILPPGDAGDFQSLLLPETARALAAGEPVTALALTRNDVAIGAVAGYLENDCFQISSLYVAPDYRRCGGGRMLLEELRELLEGHATGMEISFTVTREEHQTLLPFLEVMGFEREEDRGETLYLTTLGAVAATPFFATAGKTAGTPLSELNDGALSLLNKAAMAAGAPVPEGGLVAKSVERQISLVRMNGSKPEAYVVFDTAWSGGLTLSAVWSGSKDIVAMGDFNDVPTAPQFRIMDSLLVNKGLPLHEEGKGTIRYEGKWDLIDNFLVSPFLQTSEMEILKIPFLMTYEKKYPGEKPLRTYSGPRYIGGVSDHCPIVLRIY